MRLVPASGHRRMPWKNGGGETIEIAVHPGDATLVDFGWRVSMARVEGNGPFSLFPGIDRTLCLLDGAGLELDIADRGTQRFTTASAPFAFPADVATAARLTGGPITDLNVMTRRGLFAHAVERVVLETGRDRSLDAGSTLLLSQGRCRIEAGGSRMELGPRDAVLNETALPVRVSVRGERAIVHVVTISPLV